MQGGVGDYTRKLSKALAELGHEIHILTRLGCQPAGLPLSCTLHPVVDRWNWSLFGRVRRWLTANQIELVNLQYQTAAFDMHPAVNLLAGRPAGRPLAVTFHDLKVPYLFPKAGQLRWWLVLALARRAGGVIVTNHEDHQKLLQHRVTTPLTVIPIGSNITPALPAGYRRNSWRERWGVQAGETLIGYFGFLNQSKGGQDLILTLDHLRGKEVPSKLLMIGGRAGSSDPSNLDYARQIDDLISRYGLERQVIWTGYISDEEVSASLMAADVCLLPYRDGISFRRGSFMAALAHGCAIISTTPAVELPELRHGENIFLVPPAAPLAMAEAVLSLRNEPRLREALSRGALALAQGFRWDVIAKETLAFLNSLKRDD